MLRADDIVNYQLKQTVRGYSMPQVDELLDQVADELERVQTELGQTKTRLEQTEARLSESSETESTLKRTLVTAQQAAERSIEEAKERAAQIVDEARRGAAGLSEAARLDAEEVRVDALQNARAEEAEIRRRRQDLEQRVEALRIFEREYRGRLRSFLEEQLHSIDHLVAVPASDPDAESEVSVPAAPAPTDDVEAIVADHLAQEQLHSDAADVDTIRQLADAAAALADRDPAQRTDHTDEFPALQVRVHETE